MRAVKFFKLNCRERSERKFFGKFCIFSPNSSKLRSDYLFSFQKRTSYLFPAFSRSEYLFPKSASPPPPSESNGRPLKCVGKDGVNLHWVGGKHLSFQWIWTRYVYIYVSLCDTMYNASQCWNSPCKVRFSTARLRMASCSVCIGYEG